MIGVVTSLTKGDAKAIGEADATFGASASVPRRLLDAARANDLPLLPGAATLCEAMSRLRRSYFVAKLLPAEASRGISVPMAWGAPLPQIRFCPAGGASLQSAARLPGPNPIVACLAGFRIAPAGTVQSGDWTLVAWVAADAVAPSRDVAR